MIGSLVFQHDYSFILNQLLRFSLKDKMTHMAIVTDDSFRNGDTTILNAMPRGIIKDKLSSISHYQTEIEIWTPTTFKLKKIITALRLTEEEVLGKPYGYLQVFGYVPYFLLRDKLKGIGNPFTNGVWCSEYADIYLNHLGWDPVNRSDKNATRPQEIYESVIKSGYFKKTVEKRYKSDEFVFFN